MNNPERGHSRDVIVVGASAGGVEALRSILLAGLPPGAEAADPDDDADAP